jgi:hypothetical protein
MEAMEGDRPLLIFGDRGMLPSEQRGRYLRAGACIGIFSGDDPRMLKADVRLFEEHSSRGR